MTFSTCSNPRLATVAPRPTDLGSASPRAAARRIVVALACLAASFVAGTASAQNVDFEKEVLPILENRCTECHRAAFQDARGRTRRPKADLRFDGKHWILRGSGDGPVLVPGKPEQSSMYTMTVLPADDLDIMPAKGDPLTKDQTETLRRWIEQGAEFGDWIGEPGPTQTPASGSSAGGDPRALVKLYAELAKGVDPVADEALEKARASGAAITTVVPDSPLLRIDFVKDAASITDRDAKKLGPVVANVARLSFARTKVGDASVAIVQSMPKLVHLDLSRTKVTDAALAALEGLDELRTLNLYGTGITDAGIARLPKLKRLETVYVGETEITTAGLAALRRLAPKATVHTGADLPSPETPEEDADRPGRRRG